MAETKTKSVVGITANLQCRYLMNDGWTVEKYYQGRSTRRVTKKQKSEEVLQKHRKKMTKEAKTVALEECFRERLGFTEFKDVICDELNRPMKV